MAKNNVSQRLEALKVWLNRRSEDKRDKLEQGKLEAQKLARLNNELAVKLFRAEEFNGYIVASMEYFEAFDLDTFVKDKSDPDILNILWQYLEAIEITSNPDTFHGDAHSKNVLVREIYLNYENII